MKAEIIKVEMQDIVVNVIGNFIDILKDMKKERDEVFAMNTLNMIDIISFYDMNSANRLLHITQRFKDGLTFLMLSQEQKQLIEGLDERSEPFLIQITCNGEHVGFVHEQDVNW